MEIIPDPIHAALLTLPFLAAAVSLYFILWKPLLAYLDERDEVSAKAHHEAHELGVAATEQLGRIETRLAQARMQVSNLRQQARSRALAKEAEILAETRGRADKRMTEAMSEIARDRTVAATALESTANELSNQIAGQVLGRPVA